MLPNHPRKVAAGERLSAADGELLFRPEVDLHAVGELANTGPPAQERRAGLLQRQRPSESHQRLRLSLPAVRLQSRSRRSPGVCDGQPTRSLARGEEAVDGRLHGTAHRGRAAPRQRRSPGITTLSPHLHEAFPALHLKAFTAVEIAWFAETAGQAGRGDPRSN